MKLMSRVLSVRNTAAAFRRKRHWTSRILLALYSATATRSIIDRVRVTNPKRINYIKPLVSREAL